MLLRWVSASAVLVLLLAALYLSELVKMALKSTMPLHQLQYSRGCISAKRGIIFVTKAKYRFEVGLLEVECYRTYYTGGASFVMLIEAVAILGQEF